MGALLHGLPSPSLFLLLLAAAGFAGFVDAAVGGGGLINVPALLLVLPAGPVMLGTNKAVSFTGTTLAAGRFLRAGALGWRDAVPPMLAAVAGSAGGVWLAYRADPGVLRPLMLLLLVAMLAFTLLKPELGSRHAPRFGLAHQRGLSALIALALGFYDGFFGPGVGTLLIFLFVTVLGFDFLRASALAKAVNWSSNLCAVVLFLSRGSWVPVLAVALALANGAGGWLGAHTALTKGSRWVRILFVAVASALVLKLGWQVVHP